MPSVASPYILRGSPAHVIAAGVDRIISDARSRGEFPKVSIHSVKTMRRVDREPLTGRPIRCSEGRKNGAGLDKLGYIPDGRNIFLKNINPEATDRERSSFTVAPGPTGFELELGDADLFSDTKGTVPLGI